MRTPDHLFSPALLVGLIVVGLALPLEARLMTQEQVQEEEAQRQREEKIETQADNVRKTNDVSTLAQLQKLTTGGVQWSSIDVKAALANLAAISQADDPNHIGIRFLLHLPSNPEKQDVLGRTVERTVHIVIQTRQPLSLLDLLNVLSDQTNLAFSVQKGTVILRQWQPDDFISLPDRLME
jgi:hypothetical protein